MDRSWLTDLELRRSSGEKQRRAFSLLCSSGGKGRNKTTAGGATTYVSPHASALTLIVS
jgi:hypothetical protein